ncbi:MAG: F0F1 ATP synthase subunit alpha, partial [Ignavibacteria bacterium]|nr:F0F1 ATP synthase subunit alpha [Ignavibacteria bacterium]
SDLDKATLAQLRRGSRLVELLKQGQYQPTSVEKQVVSLFAGTNGYLDEIPVEQVSRYEHELHELMDVKHPVLLREIMEKKDLTQEITGRLNSLLREFTDSFKVSVNA